MATLEQLAEGIRRAHEAGNAEHVRVLGEAYRKMQAEQQGGSAYEDFLSEASANSQRLQGGRKENVDLPTATAATISGIVNGIPVLGPLAQGASDAIMGGVSQLTGGDYGETVKGLQDRRQQIADRAPVARMAGELAGSVGSIGALGAIPAGAQALGLSGNLGSRVASSALSSQGIYTADQLARGKGGVEATGYGVPAAVGGAIPMVGAGLKAAGQGVANSVTRGAQRRVTDTATKGAMSSQQIKSAASDLFEQATGGQPLMISDGAYFRFLGGVKKVADKLRINVDNDQQSVGLLNTLMRIADETASGVRPDMKDLHLVRQLAADVAQSSRGRDKAFGSAVIGQMDDFIRSLKPGDILGGANPTQAANSLLTGISAWSRANKVAAIENAIRVGEMAASGPEKGVRNALRALMKDEQTWRQFSAAEKRAIEDVVNGTGASNLLKLLGTFGFGHNVATNGIGGAAGMALGGMAAGPVGMVAGPAIGALAKKGSEAMTGNLARRALAAASTPNLPVARQAPNLLAPAQVPLEVLLRGAALSPAVQ